MAIERTYIVPLRRGFWKTPRYRRTNRAVATLQEFLAKHMKAAPKQVRIGQHLNELIWERGIRNPPARVEITVKKDDDGLVTAELVGKTYASVVKPQAAKSEPQGLREKLQAAIGGKDEAKPETEESKEDAQSEQKPKVAKKKVAKKDE